MNRLVSYLIEKGHLKNISVIQAFLEINRQIFISSKYHSYVNKNVVIPIGFGQTNSQPSTVAFMLELLDINSGHKILDIGSGSGWTTSLLSYLVGEEGKIIAVEIIEELKELGEKNAEKFNFVSNGRASFFKSDGNNGWRKGAPYDRILVSAEAKNIPVTLLDQMKINAKMVIPINNSIWLIEKKTDTIFSKQEFKNFLFVPLVENEENNQY